MENLNTKNQDALADVVVGSAPQSDNNSSAEIISKVSMCSSAHVVVGDGCTAASLSSKQPSDSVIPSKTVNSIPSEFHKDKDNDGRTTQLSQTRMQYATVARRRGLPSFAQSVVCDAIDGATNDDYMDQFEKLTSINNLIYFSKISENRVCFTVNSVDTANKILVNKINIKGQTLGFRPLQPGQTVYKYKRFVISNILPQIPNDVILDHLKALGLSTKNGISNIRCSSVNELRKHVQSHRRQFYLKEEDVEKLPSKIKITHENIHYWIFIGADDIKCHFCKGLGHIAKYCPSLPNQQVLNSEPEDDNSSPSCPLTSSAVSMHRTRPAGSYSLSPESQQLPSFDMELDEELEKGILKANKKRAAPGSLPSSNTSTILEDEPFTVPNKVNNNSDNINAKKTRRRRKKAKTIGANDLSITSEKSESSSESESGRDYESESGGWFDAADTLKILDPIKTLYNNPAIQKPLDFDKFGKYIIESKGKRNIVEFTEKFTDDLPALTTFLDLVLAVVVDTNVKNRIKRLNGRLLKAIDLGIWPSDAKKLALSEGDPSIT